jgi:SAM-dependent methyltransferase
MRFLREHARHDEVEGKRVLEMGSLITDQIRGSAREIFQALNPALYFGIDMRSGPGVDIQMNIDDLEVRFEPEWFDVIVCAEVLEHVNDWRKTVKTIKNLLKPGGVAFVTTRSHGFWYHPEPEDHWRFTCGDFSRIFRDMNLEIMKDPDFPGVFMRAVKTHCVDLDKITISQVYPPGHYRSAIAYNGPHPPFKFSIITPTVLRPSLERACRSIERQKYTNWEHIIMVDLPNAAIPTYLAHPQRKVIICDQAHKNYGITCRHNAIPKTSGMYVLYLDDDNFYSPRALMVLAENIFLNNFPDWGVFPMKMLGKRFFNPDPGLNKTDTNQFFHKPYFKDRLWSFEDTQYHAADGLLVEELKKSGPPCVIDPGTELVYMPVRSWGAGDAAINEPSRTKNYCVVIPNKYEDIINPLIHSIEGFEKAKPRIIVVADGHERGYGFEVVSTPDHWPFIFARQCNVGIEAAGKADVILINDDVRLLQFNTFATMWRVAQDNPDVGIISPLIDGGVGNPKQRAQWKHHWPTKGLVYCSGLGEDYICFPFVYLRRAMLDQIGLLDERFIRYGKDDADLCRRAVEAGWKLGITKDVVVAHGRGGDSNVPGDNFSLSFVRHPELITPLERDPYEEKWSTKE